MKIAFISTILGYPWGGADVLWTEMAELAIGRGHAVLIGVSPLVAGHPRLCALQAADAEIVIRTGLGESPSRLRRRLLSLIRPFGIAAGFLGSFRTFAPDLTILCQGGVFDFMAEPAIVASVLSARRPFAIICQSNNDEFVPDALTATRARRLFSQAVAVVFVSEHNRRLAERQIGQVVPNAIVTQNPVSCFPAQPIPWEENPVAQLTVVSRLDSHNKGLDFLLPALAAEIGEKADWQLHFFGRGPDRASLEREAAELGLSGHICFHGFIDDPLSAFKACHLFLLPSRWEGNSLALVEALLCARPVLATAVGGASEWIEDGKNGFLCSPTKLDFALALRRAWQARQEWPQMGVQARMIASARIHPAPSEALLIALESRASAHPG